MLSVGSSAVALQCWRRVGPTLVRARGTSSWALYTAQDGSPTCQAAPTVGGTTTNVATGKTPELCAQVQLTSPRLCRLDERGSC